MSSKKILIILIIILVLVLSALAVYNLFFREKNEDPPTQPPISLNEIFERIHQISAEPAIGAAIDQGKVKYYLKNNGNVFEANLDGSGESVISSNFIPNLIKVLWSPQNDKVISFVSDGLSTKKYSYNYSNQTAIRLNDNILWLDWAPQQDKIAYHYYDSATETNNISLADADGSNWENILNIRMKDLIIKWPTQDRISIQTKPSGLAQSITYFVEISTGELQKIIDRTYGLTTLWSPLGNKVLFSETNEQGKDLKLKIADLDRQTISELNFATLPEKCVWSQDNRHIFCAIPEEIPSANIIPDDYYQGTLSFSDNFWQINLATGEAQKILDITSQNEVSYDANNLILSEQEDYLLFINQLDGLLYSLEL